MSLIKHYKLRVLLLHLMAFATQEPRRCKQATAGGRCASVSSLYREHLVLCERQAKLTHRKMCQPQSRYWVSPVTLQSTNTLSTVSGRKRLCASCAISVADQPTVL